MDHNNIVDLSEYRDLDALQDGTHFLVIEIDQGKGCLIDGQPMSLRAAHALLEFLAAERDASIGQ